MSSLPQRVFLGLFRRIAAVHDSSFLDLVFANISDLRTYYVAQPDIVKPNSCLPPYLLLILKFIFKFVLRIMGTYKKNSSRVLHVVIYYFYLCLTLSVQNHICGGGGCGCQSLC